MIKPFFTGYRPQFYFRTISSITYDEHHNEIFVPSEIQAEIDAHDRMVADIRDYVEECVDNGKEPDDYAFCVMHRIDNGGVPGTIVGQIIARELAKYENHGK